VAALTADRVVVLGAGPAGSAAAITLARAGLEVVLVDPRPAAGWEPGEGLPAAAGAPLRALGVWAGFRAAGHLECSGFLSAWGSAEPAFRPALLDPRGPSWQLDRTAFTSVLRDTAGDPLPHRLTGLRRDDARWELTFAGEPPMPAAFVVDATGRGSAVARLLGVPRRVDSRLIGIAALLDDPAPDDAVSIVEAVPDGWWYASRVPGDKLVVVLFTDPAVAGPNRLTEPEQWSARLAETVHTGPRAGAPRHRPAAPLRTVAAGSSALDAGGGPGWVATGDAAHAHEPLSARGLHDALTGGIAAGEAIAAAAGGDDTAIDRYAAGMAAGYRRYLAELDWFYAQEKRFPAAPFWRGRNPQP
jgi:2-polyprenyl-6-methoxyphenol hydroxylase-like FAD-dependent oxidoreductase